MKDLAWVFGIICAVAALGVGGFVVAGGLEAPAFLSSERQPPDEWDPMLAPYVDFVEAERGLEFEHPVHLRLADISAVVLEDFESYRAAEAAAAELPDAVAFADPYGEAYILLGLAEFDEAEGSDAANDEAIAENAGGFYSPSDLEIVLPDDEDEAALRFTIVHELVHALQDQHGLLVGYPDSADASQARTALVEGDAERIAQAWFASQSPAEQQEYFDAIGYDENTPFVEEGNTYLESTFFVSYSIGPPMVEAIIATDGIEALEQMMRARDVGTTERFIDLLGASETSSVDAFAELELPESADFVDGDLGAVAWFAALAPSAGTDQAFDALVGYDDDAFVIYANEQGETCGRFGVFFDTADDAAEFLDIAVGSLGVQVGEVDGRQVVLDVCAPLGDPNEQMPRTLFPLIVVNELALYHLVNGEPEDVARCAAIEQASTISVVEPITSFVGYEVLLDTADQFVARCAAG